LPMVTLAKKRSLSLPFHLLPWREVKNVTALAIQSERIEMETHEIWQSMAQLALGLTTKVPFEFAFCVPDAISASHIQSLYKYIFIGTLLRILLSHFAYFMSREWT
jgi:hypothetical protein